MEIEPGAEVQKRAAETDRRTVRISLCSMWLLLRLTEISNGRKLGNAF
ncbi:MAG: hypothetical protein ACLPID_16545 [Beijerinckiaceae bacterium]